MGRAQPGAMRWWWWSQCSEQEMAEQRKKKAVAGFVSALFATRPERAFYIIT